VTLSEKAEEALTEIFEDFQVNGSLGIEELTKFLRNSVNSLGSALTSEQNARSIAS
jgi:hypothetical protein